MLAQLTPLLQQRRYLQGRIAWLRDAIIGCPMAAYRRTCEELAERRRELDQVNHQLVDYPAELVNALDDVHNLEALYLEAQTPLATVEWFQVDADDLEAARAIVAGYSAQPAAALAA